MSLVWQVRLLGGLTAQREGAELVRPQSGRLASLLATLAYRPGTDHPREILAEVLWPEKRVEAARHCLRQAIVALRHMLEPPGFEAGSVIVASRSCVQLSADSARTDVQEFEQAVGALARVARGVRLEGLDRAIRAYGGELLPGLYDEWVLIERERLSAAYLRAVQQTIELLDSAGQKERALEYALMAVGAAPTKEECAVCAMRLSAQLGRASTGVQAYRAFRSAYRRNCDAAPSAATRALARDLRRMEQGLPVKTAFGPTAAAGTRVKLPHRGKQLVGREAELADLCRLLGRSGDDGPGGHDRSRLVWMTGVGGCGKTRLAVEAAQILAADYGDAIWFVPLADVDDSTRLAPTILDLMGGPRSASVAPIHQVAERLSAQPSFLVLDNMEHLQDRCAQVVLDLVAETPSLVCLATSRVRLGHPGAEEMELQPLPTPPKAGPPPSLLRYPAVQLFVERARAVSPGFELTAGNAAAVAALCRRLDGLPLAIELAAARSGVLTPTQMLSELAGKADILVTRQHDRALRHRALRDTIAWSYRRLPEDLKRFFSELSVFRGGWGLAAARAVCDEPMALDRLEALWERSMIWARESADEMRFGMLETMRQYADERLSAEARACVEERHSQYYLKLAERAAPGLAGVENAMWLTRLQSEQENLRAALSRIVADEGGMRMANALGRYWRMRGDFADGRDWLTRSLDGLPGAPVILRARALMNRGMLAVHAGEHTLAQTDLMASAALYPEYDDDPLYAETLIGLGVVHTAFGRFDEATTALTRGRLIMAAHGDRLGEATALSNLGRVAERQVDLDEAARRYAESAEMFREAGDEHRAALVQANTGAVLGLLGRSAEAQAIFERCIPVFRRVGNRSGLAVALVNLAETVRRQGDLDSTLSLLREAVPIQVELGDRLGVMLSVWGLANVHDKDNPALAVCLMSAIEAFGDTDGLLAPHELDHVRSDLEALRASLGEREYAAARRMGRSMSLGQATERAMAEC